MSTQNEILSTEAIAKRFYALATEGKFDEIQDELFSSDVKSTEPASSFMQSVQGIEKVKEKARTWQEMLEEMHGGYTSEPVVAGDFFSCGMGMDVTIKGQGRVKMDEICVYEVKDGKIISEQFFFN